MRLNHIIWGIKVLTYHSNNGGNPLVFWNITILKSLGKFLGKFPRWRAFFTMLNSISNLSQDFQSALHVEHLRGSASVWRSAKYFHSSDKNWPHQKRLSGVAYKCKSSFRNIYQYSKEISLVSRAIFGMSLALSLEISLFKFFNMKIERLYLLCYIKSNFWFHLIRIRINPAGNYMFKVNNINSKTRCEICSKLTIKTSERHYSHFLVF